jgi:hypothetical protein
LVSTGRKKIEPQRHEGTKENLEEKRKKGPGCAIDDPAASQGIDGDVEGISEGYWKRFPR